MTFHTLLSSKVTTQYGDKEQRMALTFHTLLSSLLCRRRCDPRAVCHRHDSGGCSERMAAGSAAVLSRSRSHRYSLHLLANSVTLSCSVRFIFAVMFRACLFPRFGAHLRMCLVHHCLSARRLLHLSAGLLANRGCTGELVAVMLQRRARLHITSPFFPLSSVFDGKLRHLWLLPYVYTRPHTHTTPTSFHFLLSSTAMCITCWAKDVGSCDRAMSRLPSTSWRLRWTPEQQRRASLCILTATWMAD